MGKRKRDRTRISSDPHEKSIKKTRIESAYREQTKLRQHDNSSSLPSTSMPVKASKRTALPDTQLSTGLSKRQRKRSRKRRRRQELAEQSRSAPQDQSRQPRASIDRSVLTSLGTTKLMKIPTRCWNEAVVSESALGAHSASQNQEAMSSNAIATILPANSAVSLGELAKNRGDSDDGDNSPLTQPAVQQNARGSERPPASGAVQAHTRFHKVAALPLGKPKERFIRKENTGPSATGRPSATVSFHRFATFLDQDGVTDSDRESNDSDQDDTSNASESDLYAASMPIGAAMSQAGSVSAEQHPQPTDCGLSIPGMERNATDVRSPTSSVEDALANAGLSHPLEERPVPDSSPPRAWPANIGVKRDSSPITARFKVRAKSIDRTLNETQSTAEPDTIASFAGLPFSIQSDGDTSEDLSRTIDEITSAVLSDTRPLPACKLLDSSDPKRNMDWKEGLTSIGYSNGRLRSQLVGLDQNHLFASDVVRQDVLVCNTARLRERHPSREMAQATETEGDQLPTCTVAHADDNATSGEDSSSSSLDELSRSPSPPEFSGTEEVSSVRSATDQPRTNGTVGRETEDESIVTRKRKMTGMTSKHFTPERKVSRNNSRFVLAKMESMDEAEPAATLLTDGQDAALASQTPLSPPLTVRRTQRKGTARKSSYFSPTKPALDPDIIDRVDFYNTTAGARSKSAKRVPAGTSTAPVPPITSERFGIIQEKLWREPFWLLIAVTFLNKTTGRAAVPVFWKLKEKYQTPEQLAAASQEELEGLVWHLGLQRQRSKRLIKMAQAWVEAPPKVGVRWRTLHYPSKGDGKSFKAAEAVSEDVDECAGALEIGKIPGCGPYAWDSWRIFCRDLLRGVAQDYNGSGATAATEAGEDFIPEWKKVLPGDKELRACLRWMWLREGWIWNCETGEKRRAMDEEMAMALKGEIEIHDEQERKFAAQAAGVNLGEVDAARAEDGLGADASPCVSPAISTPMPTPTAVEEFAPTTHSSTKAVRRSARLSAAASA